MSEFFRNGKDTMSVRIVNEFRGHGNRALNGIFIAAGRTEVAVTANRTKFKKAAAQKKKFPNSPQY